MKTWHWVAIGIVGVAYFMWRRNAMAAAAPTSPPWLLTPAVDYTQYQPPVQVPLRA